MASVPREVLAEVERTIDAYVADLADAVDEQLLLLGEDASPEFEEEEHPRGFGGRWTSKGAKTARARLAQRLARPVARPVRTRIAPVVEETLAPAAAGNISGAALARLYPPEKQSTIVDLKRSWAEINNELLDYVDDPDTPAAQQKMHELKDVVKKIHRLRVEPSAIHQSGLPGDIRDLVIVGAGPGGMSAAIAGGTEGLDTVLIEANIEPGGQARHSSRIENYPGFPVGVRGDRLMKKMLDQAERTGAETKLGVRVTELSHDPDTGIKTLELSNGETVRTRSVVLAGGLEFTTLKFPGSEGPGVFFGDGKKTAEVGRGGGVVVVGGSNGAAQAALGAVSAGATHVTLVSRTPIVNGMSAYQVGQVTHNRKITVLEGDQVKELKRDERGNPQSFETTGGKSIPVKSVGFFVGSSPKTDWLPSEVQRVTERGDDRSKIVTGADFQTGIPGVYAIGDVHKRSVVMGRVGVAVGEGQIAVRNLFEYFAEQAKPKQTREEELDQKIASMEAELTRLKSLRGKVADADIDWDALVEEAFRVDAVFPYLGQMAEADGEGAADAVEFEEEEHPRGFGGKFTEKGGSGSEGGSKRLRHKAALRGQEQEKKRGQSDWTRAGGLAREGENQGGGYRLMRPYQRAPDVVVQQAFSEEEKIALEEYMGAPEVNWNRDDETLSTILKAFDKGIIKEDTFLYRGITPLPDHPPTQRLMDNPERLVGRDLPSPPLVSTTTSVGTASDFASEGGLRSSDKTVPVEGLMMVIKVGKGAPALHLGTFMEEEVLLAHGKAHVVRYDPDGRILYAEWRPDKR